MPRRPEEELERLRAFRAKPPHETGIKRELERVRRELTGKRKAVGGLHEAWQLLAPPELANAARIEKLTTGGVLTIVAGDAAAAYGVDVWLRSGGDAKLRASCGRAVRSIRVVQAL